MTRREELQAQLEELQFSIWMDHVATRVGNRLIEENQRLQEDPAAAVPEQLTRRNLQAINRGFSRRTRGQVKHLTLKIFQRVAVAVLIVLLLAACAIAAFPQLRVGIRNLLIEELEDQTYYSFGEDMASSYDISVDWLPEGFELISKDSFSNHTTLCYEHPDGAFVEIYVSHADVIKHSADTQDATVREIEINGIPATLTQKNDLISVSWGLEELQLVVTVTAQGLPEYTVIQISEQIRVA